MVSPVLEEVNLKVVSVAGFTFVFVFVLFLFNLIFFCFVFVFCLFVCLFVCCCCCFVGRQVGVWDCVTAWRNV